MPLGEKMIEVGSLSTVDCNLTAKDRFEFFEYSLVKGEGDSDNDKFIVVNDVVILSEVITYDDEVNLSIRVRSTDWYKGTYDSPILISLWGKDETKCLNSVFLFGKALPFVSVYLECHIDTSKLHNRNITEIINYTGALTVYYGTKIEDNGQNHLLFKISGLVIGAKNIQFRF